MRKLPFVILVLLFVLFQTNHPLSVSVVDAEVRSSDQSRPELVLQTGHSKLVKAVVFDPLGRWIASASFDNTIKIWDVELGRELRSLTGHTGAIKALVCDPDGKRLASGGNDKSVRVWDVETGSEIKKFDNQKGTIETIAFSPDGKKLAFGGSENSIILLDAESGRQITALTGHALAITALAFSPDGKSLASGSSDKTIKIWDIESGKKPRDFTGHLDEISVLRFNANGTLLASGGLDKTVRLWAISTKDKPIVFAGHTEKVSAVYFVSDDKIISADSVGTIKTWEKTTKREVLSVAGSVDRDLTGEAESAAFSSDGAFLAVGNGDGTATVADAKTGKKLNILENNTIGIYGLAFSSDRHWLASAGFDNTVKLWDLQTGQSLSPLMGHEGRVRCVAFHPDNRRVISGSSDSSIRIWDTVTSKQIQKLDGHTKSVLAVAVSPTGKILVSGSFDQMVGIWNLESKASARFLKGHVGEVTSVAISSDEKHIASAGADGTIRLWDVATGQQLRLIEPKTGEIDSVAFSSDGKFLASGGIDNIVNIWDAETGNRVRSLTGHTGQIYSVVFSPNGKQIVSSGRDQTVRVWNAADGRQIQNMSGHVGSVFSLAFLPDDRWFGSASEDGSIVIWNRESGDRLATLVSLKKTDDWLVVTPDGFFDGSQPAWGQISWRFEKNTFNVKPVEEFFGEFWLPGLLAELLSGQKLPANTDISKKDRRQPVLKIALAQPRAGSTIADREIKVRIDISNAPAGAKDVRLFRNGSLTNIWRGDVLKGKSSAVLEASVPIVAGENRLSAYAFNTDEIKSRDASLTVTGSPTLARKGVMHILTIGVNEYANKDYNLTFAVADAIEFAGEFERQQTKLNRFERVAVTKLLNADATRANMMKAFADLAGQVQPEDAIVVFFAGHGVRENERFYLIPHDLGYLGSREKINDAGFEQILANGLSDEMLEQGFEKIDAGQFLFVIDACNSGQALESQEKRRGPMNSKGLAQLAYEKGIYILTAAQGFQAAKEDARLGHGYLTFALIEEGLKENVADRQPKDGQVLLREWLDYAAERVPQIDEEEFEKEGKTGRKLERKKSKAAGKTDAEELQRPRVFYRRETEARPLIVARP